MTRRVCIVAVAVALALVASSCSGSEDAALPAIVPPTADPDVLTVPVATAIPEREVVSSSADETPVFEGELAEFCTAWTQLNRAVARYIPNHIVLGADEINAAVEAVRPVVPPEAPPYVADQLGFHAYQGLAGSLAVDMDGAELEQFLDEVGDRYFQDSLRRPDNFDDAEWTDKNCPGSRAGLRTVVPDELYQRDNLVVQVPDGVAPYRLDEIGLSFEVDTEFFAIEGDPAGELTIGRWYLHQVDEKNLTTLLFLAATREADREEPYPYGECGVGSREEKNERQERIIYREPTGNGTIIVIGYRPQASDLDPAVFQISLVGDDDRAPKNLGDAGNCPIDYAIWDDATDNRYVVTAEFLKPRSDGSPSRIRGAKSPQAFASVQELLEVPGAIHALHAMRTMEFDFLTSP